VAKLGSKRGEGKIKEKDKFKKEETAEIKEEK